ncbi:hypothetical protein Efla_003862 [Eimeria flavescens]
MEAPQAAVQEGLKGVTSPSLSRDEDGAAAAAIAAAAAAAAADGLVFRRSHRGCEEEGTDGASDFDGIDARSPQSPSVDVQRSEDGMQQQALQKARAQQAVFALSATAAETLSPGQEGATPASGLPFRQVVNAVCTSTTLQRLAEAFPFIDKAPCICSESSRCSFGGERGPNEQQQRHVLKMLMQEGEGTANTKTDDGEKEPFSLFAAPAKVAASLCCDRHATPPQPANSINDSNSAAPSPPLMEERAKRCNWETFADTLDKELDVIIDEMDASGIVEKMQLGLTASISPALYAIPKAQNARTLATDSQALSQPSGSASPTLMPAVKTEGGTYSAAGSVSPPAAAKAAFEGDAAVPSVESGGIFAAIAAVECHCKEITKKLGDKVSNMRSFQRNCQWQQQQQAFKAYQPLPSYGRGQQMPLFPYRNTVPPPPSVQQLRARRGVLQRLSERKGGWEVREELPHVNGSFSDAAWFSLGCSAGTTWRRVLHSSGLPAAQQLELLRQLQGDDLVEGCFVIDTIRPDNTVSRRVVAGRKGRREFMQALCSPWAVVRGWVVRCDRDRELMLVRLVGVEIYPAYSIKLDGAIGNASSNGIKQEVPANASKEMGSADSAAYLSRRLLKAEVDIGSSGFYAALPLAAIPRYEFIGGQASGCCGKFVCAGTAVRVCLARTAAAQGHLFSKSKSEPSRSLTPAHPPLLDEATLNAAHAHVEATFVLPDEIRNSVGLVSHLQEPLGFVSALPHDAAHPQPEAADFQAIRSLQVPSARDSMEPLVWWDGGSTLLLSRLGYVTRSSGSFANPVATHRQLHAFSVLHLLGMAPPPEDKESSAFSGSVSGCKRRSSNDSNRTQALTQAGSWEAFLKQLSDGSFVSFLDIACPCDAIRIALAKAEKEMAVRAGGMGRLLAQQQGADWARRRLKAGVACARRRQLDQALQLYDSALQLRPDYADALVARGAAYANKLDYEKAVADLDAALALEPNNKNAAKYRAIVAERMGSKDAQAEPATAAPTANDPPPRKSKEKKQEKAIISHEQDRTPSPDRKCKSPEHAGVRELTGSKSATVVRKAASGSTSLFPTRNALTSAAAAANAVLEQASAAGMGVVTALSRPSSVIDRYRTHHEQQRQQLLLLEQQKRRAELIQKQLQQTQEMERQLSERKQKEQRRSHRVQDQVLAHANSILNKDKPRKRKRKHSDSSGNSSA